MKTILVVLTGQEGDDSALAAAHAIAKPFSAHVTAMRAVLDANGIQHVAVKLGSAGILENYLNNLKKTEVEKTHKAKAAFDRVCAAENIPYAKHPGVGGMTASWKEIAGDPLLSLIPETRFHDLTVLTTASNDGYERADLGAILLESGRPLLLVPAAHAVTLDTVLVAWKATPDAAHAITAAMPILAKARRVIVATVSEGGADDEHGAKAAAEQLRWYGIAAESSTIHPQRENATDAIFSFAREHRAGLLVMGGYGHSRLREIVFGGFTRRVLADAPMPVFLCH